MQIISFRASGEISGLFLCGGQMADKNEKKKSSNYSHLSELLLFLCCLTRIKMMQYDAIRCDKRGNKMLVARCLLIALYRKIFISGGHLADTE